MVINRSNSRILSAPEEPSTAEPSAERTDSQTLWIQQSLQFKDSQGEITHPEVSSSVVHSQLIAVGRRKCDDEGDMKKAAETVVNATPGEDLLRYVGSKKFGTILCDPPWQFQNRTGKGCART